MASVNPVAVLDQFDKLIKQGELFYTPTKPTFQTDEGFEFEFRVCPSFKNKPTFSATSSTGAQVTAQSTNRPPPSDGSDIDHSDPAFFVAEIRSTHKLILNKFCIFRPQHLLLSLDPKRRQFEPLDADDFAAAWSALTSLDGNVEGDVKHYVIYNGGKEAGSSRKHKHMQILAQPRAQDGDLELVGYKPDVLAKLPIVAYFHDLNKELSGADLSNAEDVGLKLATMARDDYSYMREAMNQSETKETVVPHNVMLTTDWLIMVPRRIGTLENDGIKGHVVGCQGVLGSVWVTSEEQLEAWKRVGPAEVVRQLGVAKKKQ